MYRYVIQFQNTYASKSIKGDKIHCQDANLQFTIKVELKDISRSQNVLHSLVCAYKRNELHSITQ